MSHLIYNELGTKIAILLRWRRMKLGLTQQELADKTELSLRTIEQMENKKWMGEGHSVLLSNFMRVLQALEVRMQFSDGATGVDLTGKYAGLPMSLKIEEMKKELE